MKFMYRWRHHTWWRAAWTNWFVCIIIDVFTITSMLLVLTTIWVCTSKLTTWKPFREIQSLLIHDMNISTEYHFYCSKSKKYSYLNHYYHIVSSTPLKVYSVLLQTYHNVFINCKLTQNSLYKIYHISSP